MADQAEQFQFFEVGGAVRDSLLGLSSKDVDFSVVAEEGLFATAAEAFTALETHLTEGGFKVFEARPEFLTIRAQVAEGHPLRQRTNVADFVLARRDGPYSDGRRPDWVVPGTLKDDIFRRDMTVNALARDINGNLIDFVGGVSDLENRLLRFVGNPKNRIEEDGLRVARALRFHVTKGFTLTDETWEACTSEFASEMLGKVSVERIREELNKMFRADTLNSLNLLTALPAHTREAIFRDGLRLDATLAQ
jgi:tRNA nucleotidyltransferase (CCA-adding enzyme)